MARLMAILMITLWAVQSVSADTKYWGSGKDFGKGWAVDDRGNVRGMGKEFGKGYRADRNGNLFGTGKSWGERWTVSPQEAKGNKPPYPR